MAEGYDDRVSRSESPTRYIKQRVTDIEPTQDDEDDSTGKRHVKLKPALATSIVAGAAAGVIADITLHPLDTLKTRLQSKIGFRASGGFKGLYKGIGPMLLGSAPTSAVFFAMYNTTVNTLRTGNPSLNPLVYFISASCAEVVGSTFRVPFEIVKQRKQISNTSAISIVKKVFKQEGFMGFYRGYGTTVMREIPFAGIQFPLWEYMIHQLVLYQHGEELTALQTALCGAASGAIAAAITTPMDVIKTRVILEEKELLDRFKSPVTYHIGKDIYLTRGITGLFAGVIPRVLWIMLGGFIYFGSYDKIKQLCEQKWNLFSKKVTDIRQQAPSYLEEKLETFKFSKEGRCMEEEWKDTPDCQWDPSPRSDVRDRREGSADSPSAPQPEEERHSVEVSEKSQDIIDTTLTDPDEDSSAGDS